MQLQSEFWIAGWEQGGEGEGGQKGWEAGLQLEKVINFQLIGSISHISTVL